MIFTAHVTVPSHIIKQIGFELKTLLINNLVNEGELSDKGIYKIERHMEKIIAHYVSINGNSYEGISLDKSVINVVAHELSVGRKISAIKEFRRATGMGLRDSKTIMDRFEPTDHGAKEFIIAFS